jgi:hypothetical protein
MMLGLVCGIIEACGGSVVSSTAGHLEVRFLCDRSSSWLQVSKAAFDCFDDRTGYLRLFGVVFGRLSCIRLGPLLCGNEHVWRCLVPWWGFGALVVAVPTHWKVLQVERWCRRR